MFPVTVDFLNLKLRQRSLPNPMFPLPVKNNHNNHKSCFIAMRGYYIARIRCGKTNEVLFYLPLLADYLIKNAYLLCRLRK